MAVASHYADSDHIKDFTEILDGDWSTASRLAAINRAFCIVELSPDGLVIHANGVFRDLFGYTREELIGENHNMLCFGRTVESDEYAAFWAQLAAGRVIDDIQLRRHKNGSAVWLQAIYSPVLNPQGRVQRILKVAVDVTAAHEKAIEADSMIAAINRSSGVVTFALDGTILEANAHFAHAHGYEPEEVIGQTHEIVCDPSYVKSQDYAVFWARLRAGQFISGEFQRISRGGKPVTIRASYAPIYDHEGEIVKILKIAHVVSDNMTAAAA